MPFARPHLSPVQLIIAKKVVMLHQTDISHNAAQFGLINVVNNEFHYILEFLPALYLGGDLEKLVDVVFFSVGFVEFEEFHFYLFAFDLLVLIGLKIRFLFGRI